jgi:hypothetical protein
MRPSTFLQTLKTEVARMQAVYPEREGELARAHALIVHGMVVPSPDDPATGQVLSSDLQTTYTVNGTCDCQAGQHGRGCKHVQAWRLYQYVERKLAAQTPAPVEPPVEPWPDNDVEGWPEKAPVETPEPPAVPVSPPPLPEAPASINVRLTIGGREVQLTLRDSDEARLLKRLQTVLAQYPVEQKPASPPQPQGQGKGWCAKHGLQMTLNQKEGRSWWSHRLSDGNYCKGR